MEAVGHLRSAASERAESASGIWEIGVFFVVKRAVYKRSVGRGQRGEGAISARQSGVKGKNGRPARC